MRFDTKFIFRGPKGSVLFWITKFTHKVLPCAPGKGHLRESDIDTVHVWVTGSTSHCHANTQCYMVPRGTPAFSHLTPLVLLMYALWMYLTTPRDTHKVPKYPVLYDLLLTFMCVHARVPQPLPKASYPLFLSSVRTSSWHCGILQSSRTPSRGQREACPQSPEDRPAVIFCCVPSVLPSLALSGCISVRLFWSLCLALCQRAIQRTIENGAGDLITNTLPLAACLSAARKNGQSRTGYSPAPSLTHFDSSS